MANAICNIWHISTIFARVAHKNLFFHKKVKSGGQVLKSPRNPFFFKYSLTRINFEKIESFESSSSTDEMSSVQKLGVPVRFF